MKALAILATVALVLLGRWWRDALSDARLAAVDEEDAFVPMAAWVPVSDRYVHGATLNVRNP
jgi:hypothetical protein